MGEIDTYGAGMADALSSAGFSKEAAAYVASASSTLRKKAALFNFGDGYDGGGFSWSSVLIPLAAAALAGTVGYQSGIQGRRDRSAFNNIKNFLGRTGNELIRKSKPRPMYDYKRLLSEHLPSDMSKDVY